jgi:hypothetical protein
MSVQIFLSAVTDEFSDYRDQLRRDLTRDNVEVKIQEDFKDYGIGTLAKLDRYIAGCDAVVHLVGNMTGSAAKATSTQAILAKYPDLPEKLPPLRDALDNVHGISYTQWEAWLALYHDKVLLIAKADDAAARGVNYASTEASRIAQRTHLERLRAVERYPGFTFASPDNLAKQIAYTAILDLLAETRRPPVAGSFAREVKGKIKKFLDEYLVSETGVVPFGGRDCELERLDAWLADAKAAPRMLVTAPAGRGKSALLVQWMKSLQNRGLFAEDSGLFAEHKWRLAFMPISIRVGTNQPSVFLDGLARRLAEITGGPIAPEAVQISDALKNVVQDRLETIASTEQRVLVVVDGLDEALQGTFDSSIIPARLPQNLRVVLSARWQVGDIDSAGWLGRLGWDRNIRVERLELESLTPEATADVLLKLGAPIDVLARQPRIVDRLSELTEGEPILVRFYAEDLWQLGQHRARITIGDLDSLKPGFGSYFARWLSYQEKLWDDEGLKIAREEVDRVLSILAFALGPLESRDLLDLMKVIHQRDDLISEHRLLQPLRRFILGNGRPESGYVLSHPKIGEYLQGERFGARAAILRRGFAVWGLNHLRDLNAARVEPQDASHYALQFLRGHFENAGLPAIEWAELVENGWRLAWEQFEGVPRGFASDVQAAWHRVRQEVGPPAMIGTQWRCALVLSSIRSIGLNTPDALLCAAVAHGLLSIRQAIHFVDIGRSDERAASLLLQLSQLNVTSSVQSADLISAALEKAGSCRNEWSRAYALGSLAPHLSPEQIAEALAVAKAIGDEGSRARALGLLAPHLSLEQKT